MEKRIEKTAGIEKHEFVTGTKWYAAFYADVYGSEYLNDDSITFCGSYMFDNRADAIAAANAWIACDDSNDALAIELTDSYFFFDPWNGADYGDVLKSTIEMLATPEGLKDIIRQQLDMIREAE